MLVFFALRFISALLLLTSAHDSGAQGYDDFEDEYLEGEEFVGALSNTNFLQVYQAVYTWQDLERSAQKSHYHTLTGSTPIEIATKINKFAAVHPSVREVVPCSDLNSTGVEILVTKLSPFVDSRVKLRLPQGDGRQLYTNNLENGEKQFYPQLYRDALCAETMKLWAHHILDGIKTHAMDVILPSLPVYNARESFAEATLYNKSLSFVAGHGVVETWDLEAAGNILSKLDDWPHWPKKAHWRAKSHGPYPFWHFGAPARTGWGMNISTGTTYLYNPGVEMEVWHSTPEMAMKIYQPQCRWDWFGFPELVERACVALHLNNGGPNGTWYLYTVRETKESDEEFCCQSTWKNTHSMHLGTINHRFIDNMKYVGEVEFHGDFYDGQARRYVMASREYFDEPTSAIDVWYETDVKGRPLRLGELGRRLILDQHLRDSDVPLIYQEMDPESFADAAMQVFPDTVFDVPEVCHTNVKNCQPVSNNLENFEKKST